MAGDSFTTAQDPLEIVAIDDLQRMMPDMEDFDYRCAVAYANIDLYRDKKDRVHFLSRAMRWLENQKRIREFLKNKQP